MSTHPLFVGFIPDGNRRAMKQTLGKALLSPGEVKEAYLKTEALMRGLMETSRDNNVGILTMWGFSTANRESRPIMEQKVLFEVFEKFLTTLMEWMDKPENSHIRLVHIGRSEYLSEQAPVMWKILQQVCEHTKSRTGMTVAIALDYGGWDELQRAIDAGGADWKQHLDLPRQGVAYQPLDLIIRTGEEPTEAVHDNEFLLPYRGETRVIYHKEFLPEYTMDMFRADLAEVRTKEQRRGK